MMENTVKASWLQGQPIRRARKKHRCNYWHGMNSGGRCQNIIATGDLYVQGDPNDTVGGFGADRYCWACIGPEARLSLSRTT